MRYEVSSTEHGGWGCNSWIQRRCLDDSRCRSKDDGCGAAHVIPSRWRCVAKTAQLGPRCTLQSHLLEASPGVSVSLGAAASSTSSASPTKPTSPGWQRAYVRTATAERPLQGPRQRELRPIRRTVGPFSKQRSPSGPRQTVFALPGPGGLAELLVLVLVLWLAVGCVGHGGSFTSTSTSIPPSIRTSTPTTTATANSTTSTTSLPIVHLTRAATVNGLASPPVRHRPAPPSPWYVVRSRPSASMSSIVVVVVVVVTAVNTTHADTLLSQSSPFSISASSAPPSLLPVPSTRPPQKKKRTRSN